MMPSSRSTAIAHIAATVFVVEISASKMRHRMQIVKECERVGCRIERYWYKEQT